MYICMYVCRYACMYVSMLCMYACMYVQLGVHTYTYTAIIYYCRNTLTEGILVFVHFNLIIALFIALLIFVGGIETATGNEVHNYYVAIYSYVHIMVYFS